MMFKGFTTIDLLKEEPRVLIVVLAEQLVLADKAIATQAEEIKQLRNKVDHVSSQQMADTM
jgi:hypothetical protein